MTPATYPRRLPLWGQLAVIGGAVLTYFVVGTFLHSPMFRVDLERLATDPGAWTDASAETIAPFVLLLIPAILGGIGTRAVLRRILAGIHAGEPIESIAKAVGGQLVGGVLLVAAALWTDTVGRH